MTSQIFIAAGGKGTRLGDLTAETPKSMINVYGRPIIDHIVSTAQQAGVDSIVVGLDEEKPLLRKHLTHLPVSIQEGCTEPLTTAFFDSAARRRPDVMIGVNGDTVYHPESIQRVLSLLERDSSAAAALLLTKVVKPITSSTWTYWLHRIQDGEVVAMDEVAGHLIRTEYVVAAFRTTALEALSDGFTRDFSDRVVPFECYSYGWDYLLRLLLWKGEKVLGMVNDDLTLNINYPSDIAEAVSFFEEPNLFRWNRMRADGAAEPLESEHSLVILDAPLVEEVKRYEPAYMCTIESSLRECGLVLVRKGHRGEALALLVEGKGAYHRAQLWAQRLKGRYNEQGVHATFSTSSFDVELERQLSTISWL